MGELVQRRRSQSRRARVCVIDSKEVGLAYTRLEACHVDVMGSLPSLAQLNARLAATYDVILVGCTERLLLSPAFRARAQQLSLVARLIAVVPAATEGIGAHAANLGFAGLVSSDVTPGALERTIAAALRGERAFPRSVLNSVAHMVSRAAGTGAIGTADAILTPRQSQIVDLIAQGATDREIARVLQISDSTAHKHVQNALRRLNARTRSQLVASARQLALPAPRLLR